MKSPFKFLDAYTLKDKDSFFGRDKEIAELYNMVFKTPLMLVYGQSGTGKTSLIQCGLASRFDGPDWYPFYIRRQSDINQSLCSALSQATNGAGKGDLIEAVSYLFNYHLRPVYLIFDQFEELFTVDSNVEEQRQFMEDIQKLLEAELPCKIILVMREEFIGQLYNLEKVVPSIFDFRLRVEPMNAAKVKEVMTSSFQQFNIKLEGDADERLQEMIDNISAGKSGIQLPYLQVYLDMLYREDYERTYGQKEAREVLPELVFTQKEIEDFGRIDEVLEKFLQEQSSDLQKELNENFIGVPSDAVWKTLDAFVTEEGTKRPVYYQREDKLVVIDQKVRELVVNIPEKALSKGLESLEQRRLLRFSDDSIELAHDSLAALIDQQRTDEQRQLNEIKRRLKNNYGEHLQTGEFLSAKQLAAYEDFIPKIALDPIILQFIENSKRHSEALIAEEHRRQEEKLRLTQEKLEVIQRSRRRTAILSVVIAIIAVASVAFGLLALQKSNQARQAFFNGQLQQAESAKSDGRYGDALQQLAIAQDNSGNKQPRKDTVIAMLLEYRQLYELMTLADSLRETDSTWVQALEQYKAAAAISPDQLIQNKITGLERDIETKFEDLKIRAERILEFTGCEYALGVFRLALQLKPGDEYVLQKIEECMGD